jgi:hypothetical protein
MSESEFVTVGAPMPRVASVKAERPFRLSVEWKAGSREGSVSVVDLSPIILAKKVFVPLRDDERLFASAHVVDEGTAIAWGAEDQIDLAATTIEELADETMTSVDFAAFLHRNSLSLDAAAATLGISRRQVAYYASEKEVPRYIALACAYLDQRNSRVPSVSFEPQVSREFYEWALWTSNQLNKQFIPVSTGHLDSTQDYPTATTNLGEIVVLQPGLNVVGQLGSVMTASYPGPIWLDLGDVSRIQPAVPRGGKNASRAHARGKLAIHSE